MPGEWRLQRASDSTGQADTTLSRPGIVGGSIRWLWERRSCPFHDRAVKRPVRRLRHHHQYKPPARPPDHITAKAHQARSYSRTRPTETNLCSISIGTRRRIVRSSASPARPATCKGGQSSYKLSTGQRGSRGGERGQIRHGRASNVAIASHRAPTAPSSPPPTHRRHIRQSILVSPHCPPPCNSFLPLYHSHINTATPLTHQSISLPSPTGPFGALTHAPFVRSQRPLHINLLYRPPLRPPSPARRSFVNTSRAEPRGGPRSIGAVKPPAAAV